METNNVVFRNITYISADGINAYLMVFTNIYGVPFGDDSHV